MAGIKNVGVVVACLVALIQISSSAATSYTVGDSTGWAIPSATNFYSSWASKNTYKVGDSLVFNFVSGQHTVTEVSKSDYDACSQGTSNPISTMTTSPATVSLTTAGAHYFICTVSNHCSQGQKLTVTAGAGSSSAASPSSSTTPTAEGPSSTTTPTTTTASSPPPPPSDSSSSSTAVAGVVLPVMLLAAAFF